MLSGFRISQRTTREFAPREGKTNGKVSHTGRGVSPTGVYMTGLCVQLERLCSKTMYERFL